MMSQKLGSEHRPDQRKLYGAQSRVGPESHHLFIDLYFNSFPRETGAL